MATYVYECQHHGRFDVSRPIGTATSSATCPACSAAARRVFTAPGLSTLSPALTRELDRAASTADVPPVVSSLPGRARRRPARHLPPGASRLPRP